VSGVPDTRISVSNDAPIRAEGDYVLYWMIAFRRTSWNFSLQRAVEWARRLWKPLVVFEPLRCDYPWASDRIHQFVWDGMANNAARLKRSPVLYYPFVEKRRGEGRGLLEALAARACVVVTDDYPAFFLPRMVAAAARRTPLLLEKVDSNGLLPLRAGDRVFKTAHSFRRFLQKNLPAHLGHLPECNPLSRVRLPRLERLPAEIAERWPEAGVAGNEGAAISRLPIDHGVAATALSGGAVAASRALATFLAEGLPGYAEHRNDPELDATSGLSPYLHFGQLSSHEILTLLMGREDWDLDRLSSVANGARSGWWGVSEGAEAFIDQLITWRELGFNMCPHRDDDDNFESLPDWARVTLERHSRDPRPHLYTLDELEAAGTHDELWNAAQTQLVREGRIHNYLRMLWGKKILEWSPTPQMALEAMIELNNKYALDGRDPNSYSGIFWCLGRYDRPWGPERPIFGVVRYMSSANTARKFRLSGYLQRYAPGEAVQS
jgi:deoxyribodipyrimidine photo-lyase